MDTADFSNNYNSTGSFEDQEPSNLTSCRWCLSEELVGPVLAVFVSAIFVVSLFANSFICFETLRNGRNALKKSSTILLFNLAFSNLLVAVLYLPFMIVATSAEEWIIGSTDAIREGFCEFNGFVYAYASSLAVHTLAAISFDRCLFIVRPHLHQRFMTWKAALVIVGVIWVRIQNLIHSAVYDIVL